MVILFFNLVTPNVYFNIELFASGLNTMITHFGHDQLPSDQVVAQHAPIVSKRRMVVTIAAPRRGR